ncbi:Uncharacterised protein [Mycobacterium tuberculosis]|nr:Uncharacterised protein [Mycobacterium tuberculosis]
MKLKTKPILPSSSGKRRISSSVMPVVSQLNDGERLYASIWSGNSAWIASANCRASARSAGLVSIQRMSANGAAASDLAIAYGMPPRIW